VNLSFGNNNGLDMVVPAHHPRAREAEVEGDYKFKASLDYVGRPCHKQTNKNRKK
jgi:hypothetical protein